MFIHGTGASNQFWLPTLNLLFNDNLSLLQVESLCLQLPGHFCKDYWFSLSDINNLINQKVGKIAGIQKQIAKKILNKNLQQILSADKLYLIGHSVGAVVSINYALNHPEKLKKLIITGCSFNFNQLSLNILEKLV